MEIKTTNDNKGKAQSWDAEVELTDGNSWNKFSVKLTGSGFNEWSAKMNLVDAAERLVVELKKLCEKNYTK